MAIYNEPPVAWRFVDNENKLQKNKPCADCAAESYTYKVPANYLPSFCWSGSTFFTPLSVILVDPTGTNSPVDISSYYLPLLSFTIGTSVFVAFPGQFTPSDSMPDGVWQCQITDGLNTLYSEPVEFCLQYAPCTVIEWRNSCDIYGIPYSYIDYVGQPLINRIWLDETPIITDRYETEIEESVNLLRQTIVVYKSQQRQFRIELPAPEYVVRQFNAMVLHDAITIKYGDESGNNYTYTSDSIHTLSVASEPQDNDGCSHTITLTFQQDDAAIGGICCVSQNPAACLIICEDVLGFISDFEPGEYVVDGNYIDDVDSNTIVTYNNRGQFVNPRECNYVNNTTTGQTMWFDGDLWYTVPLLTFVSAGTVSGGLQPLTLSAQMITGTFGYLYYSCNNVTFNQYPVPFTAAQMISGVTFNVPVCGSGTYHLKISMITHTCDYGESNVLSITPD
jgi:hypothetical protein